MPYIKKIIEAGQTLEIHKYYSARYGKGKAGRKAHEHDTTAEQEKINKKQAEMKLRGLLNANFKDGDYHVTFTFAPDKRPETPEETQKIYNHLMRDLRREYSRRGLIFKYVAVIEYGKRGVIHFHIVLSKIDTSVFLKVWKCGRAHPEILCTNGQYSELAAYLIKETQGKSAEVQRVFNKRWNASKNLIKPKITVEIVKANSFRNEPLPLKGYYIDKNSGIEMNYIDSYGLPRQSYIMIKSDCGYYKRC